MARLIHTDFEEFYDDDFYTRTPRCCWYEDDGLVFKFFPKQPDKAYVNEIQENTESIKTPDFIKTDKYGDVEVSIWNVRKDSPGNKTIKHISIGKTIKEITLTSSCEDFISLETVKFDASVNSLDSSFFKGCKNLKSISFREDSPLKHISSDCFLNCESLNDIVLPKNVVEVNSSAFDGCVNLKHITILTEDKELLNSIASIKHIEQITVKTATRTTNYSIKDIEIIRRNNELREKKRIEKERQEQKFSSFDNYQNDRSKLRHYYTTIICAIPFIWLMYRHLAFEILIRDYSQSIYFGAFVGVIILFVVFAIMWFVSVMLATYWDYCSKEKNLLYSIFFPVLSVPVAMVTTYLALTIISFLVTCAGSIASIFDPRFIN